MTLKEKLAKEFANKNSSPGVQGRDDLYEILIHIQESAFIAGFEKAKEAANNIVKGFAHNPICKKTKSPLKVCDYFCPAVHQIRRLGEGKV